MQPGERIRYFRKRKGLTQSEFGEKLEYSHGYIADLERNRQKPSREFLEKLNEVFGVSSDYILYGEPLNQTTAETAVPCEKKYNKKEEMPIVREPEIKYRKLIDDMIEILESGNKIRITALKANIRAFVEGVRLIKKTKSKGGD